MNKTIFKVGDKVNYYPYGDRVFELMETDSESYPLAIRISTSGLFSFTLDGKQFQSHTVPMLKLVKRKQEDWYQVFYKYEDEYVTRTHPSLVQSKQDFFIQMDRKEMNFQSIVFKKVNIESDL